MNERRPPDPSTTPTRALRHARGWLARHAYLVVAAGALLVLSRTVDFSPPEFVRLDPRADVRAPAELVGAFPERSFERPPVDPNAVQLRATLRRYTDEEDRERGPDLEVDERGEILSQPVVTTLLGVEAAVDQTVRLEDGALAINLALAATPRADEAGDGELRLEHEIKVTSRRAGDWGRGETRRVHLRTRATLADAAGKVHRVVFSVDEHLFSLDLELQRG